MTQQFDAQQFQEVMTRLAQALSNAVQEMTFTQQSGNVMRQIRDYLNDHVLTSYTVFDEFYTLYQKEGTYYIHSSTHEQTFSTLPEAVLTFLALTSDIKLLSAKEIKEIEASNE